MVDASQRCARCLEPYNPNGRCKVKHQRVFGIGQQVVQNFQGIVGKEAYQECSACGESYTEKISPSDTHDVVYETEGPEYCYEGPHTLEAPEENDLRKVMRRDPCKLIHVAAVKVVTAPMLQGLRQLILNDVPCCLKVAFEFDLPMLEVFEADDVTFTKLFLDKDHTPNLQSLTLRAMLKEENATYSFFPPPPNLKYLNLAHIDSEEVPSIGPMLKACKKLSYVALYKVWVNGKKGITLSSSALDTLIVNRLDAVTQLKVKRARKLRVLKIEGCFFNLKRVEITPTQDGSTFTLETDSDRVARMVKSSCADRLANVKITESPVTSMYSDIKHDFETSDGNEDEDDEDEDESDDITSDEDSEDGPDPGAPTSTLIDTATQQKAKGTQLFQNGDLKGAMEEYKKAAGLLRHCHTLVNGRQPEDDDVDDADEGMQQAQANMLWVGLNNNIALMCLKRDEAEGNALHSVDCIKHSKNVLAYEPANEKALFRLGSALLSQKDFENALLTLQKIANPDAKVNNKIKEVKKIIKNAKSREASMASKMMGGLASTNEDSRVTRFNLDYNEDGEVSKKMTGILKKVRKMLEEYRHRDALAECNTARQDVDGEICHELTFIEGLCYEATGELDQARAQYVECGCESKVTAIDNALLLSAPKALKKLEEGGRVKDGCILVAHIRNIIAHKTKEKKMPPRPKRSKKLGTDEEKSPRRGVDIKFDMMEFEMIQDRASVGCAEAAHNPELRAFLFDVRYYTDLAKHRGKGFDMFKKYPDLCKPKYDEDSDKEDEEDDPCGMRFGQCGVGYIFGWLHFGMLGCLALLEYGTMQERSVKTFLSFCSNPITRETMSDCLGSFFARSILTSGQMPGCSTAKPVGPNGVVKHPDGLRSMLYEARVGENRGLIERALARIDSEATLEAGMTKQDAKAAVVHRLQLLGVPQENVYGHSAPVYPVLFDVLVLRLILKNFPEVLEELKNYSSFAAWMKKTQNTVNAASSEDELGKCLDDWADVSEEDRDEYDEHKKKQLAADLEIKRKADEKKNTSPHDE